MSVSQSALRRAVESVRHLTDEHPPWQDILTSATRLLRADGACFILNRGSDFTMHKVNTDDAALHDYAEHFHTDDVLHHHGRAAPMFTLLDTQQLMSSRDRQRSSYFNDFMHKHRMRQLFSIGLEHESDTHWATFSLQRETPDEHLLDHFQTEGVRRFVAELKQAITQRRERVQQWTQASDALFEAFGEATLLVAPASGFVVHTGVRAQELLQGEGGIVRGRHLWHPVEPVRSLLFQALALAAVGQTSQSVAVPSHGAAASMKVDFVRADPRLSLMSEPLVFVRVRFRGMSTNVSPDLLQSAFPITRAQALVLAALAAGWAPKQIAMRSELSVHTVRKQIAALLEKMECSRQIELVQKVQTLVGE